MLGALHPTLALELETSDFVPRLQKIFAPRGNMSNWVSDLSEVVCGTKGTVRLRLRYSRPECIDPAVHAGLGGMG